MGDTRSAGEYAEFGRVPSLDGDAWRNPNGGDRVVFVPAPPMPPYGSARGAGRKALGTPKAHIPRECDGLYAGGHGGRSRAGCQRPGEAPLKPRTAFTIWIFVSGHVEAIEFDGVLGGVPTYGPRIRISHDRHSPLSEPTANRHTPVAVVPFGHNRWL